MRNSTLLLIVLTLTSGSIKAQQGIDIGLSGGVTNYFGDLGNDDFMQKSSIRPAAALTIRNIISPSSVSGMQYSPFNVEARFSWHRIGYDETQQINGMDVNSLRNYGRGLSFRNDVFGFASHVSYTYYPNRRLPLHKQSLAFFVYTGIGIYYGQPRADLFNGSADIRNRYYLWDDGTVRNAPQSSGSGEVIKKDGEYETNLTEWYTEGQGVSNDVTSTEKMYNDMNWGIPFGAGFRYGLNRKITLSVEFSYYRFMTDYLDDVSDSYATYSQIEQRFPNDPVKQEIAKYISDPTGKGTNGYVGPATSPRGNPDINDSYSMFSFEVAYKLNWVPRKSVTALLSKL
jgi:hypothetical protein